MIIKSKYLALISFLIVLAVGIVALIFVFGDSLNRGKFIEDKEFYRYPSENKNIADIKFSKNNEPSYEITDGDSSIAHKFIGNGNNEFEIKITNEENTSTINYIDSNNNVELKYTPLENGVKEDIILNSPPTSNQVQPLMYELTLSNLTYEYDSLGNIIPIFRNPETNEEFRIEPLYMIDANGEESTNIGATIDVKESSNPNILILTIYPDENWLKDPARKYPVIIDPTIVKGSAPVSIWRFDEAAGTTANDSLSNRNFLNVMGPSWKIGENSSSDRNSYLSFDGTNDVLARNDDTDFDFGTGSFSISGWFRHPDSISTEQVILSRYGTAGFRVYLNSSGNLCFGIDDDSTWGPDDAACSTATFIDNKWHQFEAVKSGTTSITLYADKILVATDTSISATGSLTNSTNLYIGALNFPATVTTTTQMTTSTDNGDGGLFGSWSHRNFFDYNTYRWHVAYIDSNGDIRTRSSTIGSEGTWVEGTLIDNSFDYDYEDFSCTTYNSSGTTYLHCTYSDSADQNLYYRRCQFTNTGNFIQCNDTEQTVYTSADANDDVAFPRIAIDSNQCVLLIADVEDDSETPDTDEHEVWIWKEATTCGDGVWSTHASYPQIDIGEASFTNDMPVGIESYGDLDYMIYYINTDNTGSADLQQRFVNGTTNVLGTDISMDGDIEYGARHYWSFIFGTTTVTYGTDDGTIDMDTYKSTTKNGIKGTQVNSNIDVPGAVTTTAQSVTAIADTVASGGDDVWVFATDDASAYDDIYYNTSTNGTVSYAASPGTVWVSNIGNSVRHMSSIFNNESCDVMVTWLDGTASPYSIRTKTINTGSCTAQSLQYAGDLDEIMIYNYARTEAEVRQDYLGPTTSVQFGSNPVDLIQNNLKGYWKLDEASGNASDSSGNSITLTDGSTTTYAQGKFGSGADLELSSTDYLYVADNSSLSITGNLTISAYIRPESNTAATSYNIAGKWDGANESYLLQQYGDEIRLYIDSASNYIETTSANLTNGTAYHIVGTFDATSQNAKIYVNGQIQAVTTTGTIPSSIGDDAGRFHIGSEDSTTAAANYYDGVVDEVRVYNVTFTQSMVNLLYTWAPGPQLHMKFDDGVGGDGLILYDSSPNSFDGTTEWTSSGMDCKLPGKYGGACVFDGSDYVSIPDQAALDFLPADSFTISTWIKHDTASAQQTILDKNETTGADGGYILLMESDGDITCGVDTDNTSFPLDSVTSTAATYDDNTWHHIACVKNGNTSITLYIDGIQIGQDTSLTTTGTYVNDDAIFIGSNGLGTGSYWVGSIDEVRIYDYARTDQQVIHDLNAGNPSIGSPVGSPLMYLRFDQGYGDTANDSVKSYNGNLAGATSCPSGGGACPSWSTTGKNNTALDFNSTDRDYVEITGMYSNPTNISLSAWASLDSADSSGATIISLGEHVGLTLDTSGTLSGFYYNGASNNTTTQTATYAGTGWHHFLYTIDDTNNVQKIYVDGELVGQSSHSASISWAGLGTNTFIGRHGNAGTVNDFDGRIDEVKVYNFALNSAEAKIDYNLGKINVVGALGTESSGTTESNSADRRFCIPGDTSSCNPPVAVFPLDENTSTTANNIVSGSYPGTLTNGPTWVPGKFGTGVNFDGDNDHIVTGNAFDPINAYTVTMWAYLRTTSTDDTFFSSTTSDSTLLGLYVGNGANNNLIYCNGGGCGSTAGSSNNAVTDNAWNHIAFSYNGSGTAQFYVNGINVTSDSTTSESTDTGNKIFGNYDTTNPNALDGILDDIRVYNYVRSPTQVIWDYNQGKPIAHYRLDECTGDEINDSSGKASLGEIYLGGSGVITVGSCTTSGAWFTGANGQINNSLDLDGIDDYINTNTDNLFDFGTNSFSVTAWIKPDDVNASGRIVSKMAIAGSPGFDFMLWNGYANTMMNGTWDEVSPNAIYNAGEWAHITWVKTGVTSTLYKNGQLDAIFTNTPASVNANSDSLRIGSGLDTIYYFDGQIDDVRIYNYPLNITQIKSIMNNGAVGFN